MIWICSTRRRLLQLKVVVFVLWLDWEHSCCQLIILVPNPILLICLWESNIQTRNTNAGVNGCMCRVVHIWAMEMSMQTSVVMVICLPELTAKKLFCVGVGLWHWLKVLKIEVKDIYKNYSSIRIPFYLCIFESLCCWYGSNLCWYRKVSCQKFFAECLLGLSQRLGSDWPWIQLELNF